MKETVRQRAFDLGFDLCRFTTAEAPASAGHFTKWLEAGRHGEMGYLARNSPKRIDPQAVLPGAQSVIMVAVNYLPAASSPSAVGHGVVARYARHADYHEIMGSALHQLSGALEQLVPASRSLWYVDTGPILERDLAQRAGIGFVGKHTNVISRKLGNWIFLGAILTTVEFTPDEPEHNRCGSCTRCLSACPTGAIVAPFQLDARKCISYLTIELKGSIPEALRTALGNRIYGCDDCLAACPWNRFAQAGKMMRPFYRGDLDQPELLELLGLDADGFKARFRGTPILRTKRRGLLRNVCVALGNTGDEKALPALQRAALDAEPLIAEHAVWAIQQIEGRMATA